MSSSFLAAWRGKRLNWSALLFIGGYHLALLVALPLYLIHNSPSWLLIGCTAFLWTATLMAITTGYHRLYAHRTYNVHPAVEAVLLFFGTLSAQGSVFEWAHDHRLHHRHVDTDEDPYETERGFWHPHVLWMFKGREDLDEKYLADLKQNRLLVLQDRYYGLLMAAANIFVFAAVGVATGDVAGAFVFAILVRLFLAHHCTWFINSLAHMWGSKPYSTEHSAVNNFILALLTFGEGYHNYHHTFSGDYRNGVRWYQFDPPKYVIWLLSKFGLASDLKTMDPLMIKKRLVQADRELLIDHLSRLRDQHAKAFMDAVEKTSDKLTSTITAAKTARDRYRAARDADPTRARELRQRVEELRKECTRDLKTWRRLCRLVMKMEPAV
ncbi:MAG: fatty acid desaturase [Rhodothermales bacterium]